VRSAFDWFSRLNLLQKVLALLFVALILFSLYYLLTTAVFGSIGGGSQRANTPSQESSPPRPNVKLPEGAVRISSARWEGQKAVVKGGWKGNISSVYCDLLEGGSSGKPTRWWERSVGTQMDWVGHTFTQEFVAARESEGGGALDPEASYSVVCTGAFAGDMQIEEKAGVEGTPPG
jgi:hypothetical protein